MKRLVVNDRCDRDLIGPGVGWVAVGTRNESRKWTHSESKLCDLHLLSGQVSWACWLQVHCPHMARKHGGQGWLDYDKIAGINFYSLASTVTLCQDDFGQ